MLVGGSLAGTVLVRTAVFAAADPQTPTTIIRSEHGSPGGERVLVAYQSQYGSTAEVANEVGATLAQAGARVDVRHIETIDGITDYDRVIVGGAIQYERWMSGAADFVRQHRAHLATTPMALFFICLALSQPGDDARETATGYEQKIRSIAPKIDPISVQGFAGVLDYSRMTPVARILARVLLTLRGANASDHRDWTEIKPGPGISTTDKRTSSRDSRRVEHQGFVELAPARPPIALRWSSVCQTEPEATNAKPSGKLNQRPARPKYEASREWPKRIEDARTEYEKRAAGGTDPSSSR